MARILIFDGDECLWNLLSETLQSEGYDVIIASNDYEGLPYLLTTVADLTRRIFQYVIAF
jgi:DNA-binding response OmpR family regulator